MNLDLVQYNQSDVKKVLFKLKPLEKDGLLLNVRNSKSPTSRFIHGSFHEIKNALALVQNDGTLIIIDYNSCKFWRLSKLEPISCVAFSNFNDEEVLIGKINGDISIVNFETGKFTGKLESHKFPVKMLSFSSKNLCLSSSEFKAVLWDLRDNSRLRVLHIERSNYLKQTVFMPGSHILACFQDDVVQIWNSEKFELVKQFSSDNWRNHSVKSIAFTRNGQTMLVSGYQPTLALFSIDTWKLTKLISLPENILTIKQVEFVSQPHDGGCNKIIAILAGQGSMHFYDIVLNLIVNQFKSDREIVKFLLCPKGRFIAYVYSSGEVGVYNLEKYVSSEGLREVKVEKAVDPYRRKLRKDKVQMRIRELKNQIDDILDISKLKQILLKYNEYPNVHRLKMWQHLLQLPLNVDHYNSFINNSTVSSFEDLYKKYPLESKVLIQALKKLLSNLVTWCPFFSNVEYLPVFAFPFVKVFQNNPLVCFEAVCTIIVNWCQYWFEYFPLPPINILAMAENILLEHNPELLQHFASNNITSTIYIWPLLETVFSEVLSSRNWLVLWDHILTYEISFLICATVAFNVINKSALMKLNNVRDVNNFFKNPRAINMKQFMRVTFDILKNTSGKVHPRQYFDNFKPIERNHYPNFVKFPEIMLNLQEISMGIDKELNEIHRNKKLYFDNLKTVKEAGDFAQIEEEKRLKDMEEEQMRLLSLKRAKLEMEREKLKKIKQELNLNRNEENLESCLEKFKFKRERCLDQLKLVLNQKLKIDKLLNGTIGEKNMIDLDEKLQKLDHSTSLRQLKKLSMVASLAILENVIKNVESELENGSDVDNSVDVLRKLQLETKVLEKEIKTLQSLVKTSQQVEEGVTSTNKAEGDGLKQVRFISPN